MRKFRVVEDHNISYEKAVQIALQYINTKSGKDFASTYYFTEEGVCVVNLAYKEGNVVCYPDLIKVGVALDTGEIVFIEAAGYIANHHNREIPKEKYSVSDAITTLSSALTVESVKKCIIPTDGKLEKMCYEFTCKGVDDETILVYINVDTLQEEQILLVLSTDGGTLVK
jgi:germination protein YpeB